MITLNDIMKAASQAYDQQEPDLFSGYWDFEMEKPILGEDGTVTHTPEDGRNDGLVRFLVIDLMETYEHSEDDERKLEVAIQTVERAQAQCASVVTGIWLLTNEAEMHRVSLQGGTSSGA
jgi:hypothetical protein